MPAVLDNSLDSLFKSSVNKYVATNATVKPSFAVTGTVGEYTIGNLNGEVTLTRSGSDFVFTPSTGDPITPVTIAEASITSLVMDYITLNVSSAIANGLTMSGTGVLNITDVESTPTIDLSNITTSVIALEVTGGADESPVEINPTFAADLNTNATLGIDIYVDSGAITFPTATVLETNILSLYLDDGAKLKMTTAQFAEVVSQDGPGTIILTDTTFSFTDTETSDDITTNGTISFSLAGETDYWQYSTDNGTTWIDGTGSNFTLGVGTYDKTQILVKQVNETGAASISEMSISSEPISLQIVSAVTTIDPSSFTYSDTGVSSTDNYTSNGEVSFTLSNGATSWKYSINDGSTWIDGYDSSFVLPPGTYTQAETIVRQFAEDGSYIPSPMSKGVEKFIVQDAPDTLLTNDFTFVDNGIANDDGITNKGTITLNLSNGLELWQYSIDNGTNWITGETIAEVSSFILAESSTPYDKSHILIKQKNLAGLESTSSMGTGTLTIDTTVPTAPTISSASAFNGGQSTMFAVAGTAESNETVTLTLVDSYDQSTILSVSPTADTNGDWSISSSGFSVTNDGLHTLSATVTDTAGNASTETTETLGIYTSTTDIDSSSGLDNLDYFILTDGSTLTLTALQADGAVIAGEGYVDIYGSSDNVDTVILANTFPYMGQGGENTITLGLEGDYLTLGSMEESIQINATYNDFASDSSIINGDMSNIDIINGFTISEDTLKIDYGESSLVTTANTFASLGTDDPYTYAADLLANLDPLHVCGFVDNDNNYYIVVQDEYTGLHEKDIVIKLTGVNGTVSGVTDFFGEQLTINYPVYDGANA